MTSYTQLTGRVTISPPLSQDEFEDEVLLLSPNFVFQIQDREEIAVDEDGATYVNHISEAVAVVPVPIDEQESDGGSWGLIGNFKDRHWRTHVLIGSIDGVIGGGEDTEICWKSHSSLDSISVEEVLARREEQWLARKYLGAE